MAKAAKRKTKRSIRKTSAKAKSSVRKSARKATARKSARKTTRKATSARRGSGHRAKAKTSSRRRWSAQVTEHSDALDLRDGVFKLTDPKKIASSLKRSAQASHRRKSDPYRSAVSMLTFYINRGGKNLPASRRRVLERAKDELRKQFHRA